ncbi:MAG: hypothetical protein N2510_03015 [Ignavibacteria bacterium]|nr:hypothetical protein [Ignavibacteria bacterium]
MSATEENIISKKNKKRKFIKKLIAVFFTFLILIVLLLFSTQTTFFKNWLKGYITEKFNLEFIDREAVLSVETLEGNFFSEIIIKNASLKVQKDRMLGFDELRVRYDIFSLFDKRIVVKELLIVKPEINFVRVKTASGDSLWNYEYVFKTEKEEDEEVSEFEWKIIAERVLIENLNFRMLAYKKYDIPVTDILQQTEEFLNSDNLAVNSLNLECKAEYSSDAIKLLIHHMGFGSNFGFLMKGMSGEFYISDSRTEINNLNIETSRSWINSEYVFVDKLNVMNITGLETFKGGDKLLRLSLTAKNFDFDDLKAFLPQVDFLDKDVFLFLKAGGIFDDINIEKLELKTNGSNLNFSGRMKNLTQPDELWFDVKGTDLSIDPRDTEIHMPGLFITDYSHLGIVTGDISYTGEISDFNTVFDISSSAGNARGEFSLNMKGTDYLYNASVDVSELDLGRLIKDQSLNSKVNGRFEVNGRGFSLASLNTTLKYDIRNTNIFEQRIERSSGTLTLRNYNIETDIIYVSASVDASVKGNINIRNLNEPVYSLNGVVRKLDISGFTGNSSDKSSLSFSFNLNGRGISPTSAEGEYNFNFSDSYYGNYDIPATSLNVKLSLKPSFSFINFNSDFADLSVRGKFSLPDISDVVLSNIYMIQNGISGKFKLDTLLPKKTVSVNRNDMNFTYEIITKNPELVERIFFLSDLKFKGKISGNIINSSSGFNGYSKISLDNISYKDTVFAARNLEIELKHLNDYRAYKGNDFSSFNSFIAVKAESLRNNSAVFENTDLKMNLADENQKIVISAAKDSSVKAVMEAGIDLSGDKVILKVDSLGVEYYKLNFNNDGKLIVTYENNLSERKFNFENFRLSGDLLNAELAGIISLNGESDFTAEATSVNIPKLFELVVDPNSVYSSKESEKFKTPLSGKIRRVTFFMKGSFENPQLSLEMNTGIIRYNKLAVGRIDAFLDYSDQNLATDIIVSNSGGQGRLRLKGDIPFHNPFVTPDSTLYADVMLRPLNLNLTSKDFQINFFSKLIPNFSDIRGFLNANLSAKGTVSEPELSGEASINKGRFFFSWTGLYYRFETILKTSG